MKNPTSKFFFLMALLTLFGVSSCSKMTGGAKKNSNGDYYTCTMHPSVESQNPDRKSPICSIDLVAGVKKVEASTTPPPTRAHNGARNITYYKSTQIAC